MTADRRADGQVDDHAGPVSSGGGRAARIARARSLRAEEGLSEREIARRLEVSSGTLSEWLRGVDPPAWTRRPNAKDALAGRARELRAQAWSVPEIAEELGVARSTAWRWVRDLPLDAGAERRVQRRLSGRARAAASWADNRRGRESRRRSIAAEAAAAIPAMSDAEILRCGALVYWCEGEKAKPWRSGGRVQFINSDPGLIDLFLAFLRVAEVEPGRITFRLHIHETAEVDTALNWWADRVGREPATFRRTTLKRHNPVTVRHNTGEHYRGCLVVSVLRSHDLYWTIEGIVSKSVAALIRG